MEGGSKLGPAPCTFNKNFLDLADELVHLRKRVPHQLGDTVQTMCDAEAVEDVGVQLLKALPCLHTVGGAVREEEEHLLVVQVTPEHLEQGRVHALLDCDIVGGP